MGQFDRAVKGYQERLKKQAEQADTLNHSLGYYIAYAVNDLEHYPDKPFMSKQEKIQNSPEVFRQMAKKRWGRK